MEWSLDEGRGLMLGSRLESKGDRAKGFGCSDVIG